MNDQKKKNPNQTKQKNQKQLQQNKPNRKKKKKSDHFQQELESSRLFREPPNQWLLAKIRQNLPHATHYEYFF